MAKSELVNRIPMLSLNSFSDIPKVTSVPALSYSSSEETEEEPPRRRRGSSMVIAGNTHEIKRLVGTEALKQCCGGGCSWASKKSTPLNFQRVVAPDNDAYRGLQLKINRVPTNLSDIPDLAPRTVSLLPIANKLRRSIDSTRSLTSASSGKDVTDFTPHPDVDPASDTSKHPPSFVQPHPPFAPFSAKIFSARELTKPGAEKRTYHFDLDISNYPDQEGVEFKVGGAIGVVAPNDASVVEELLEMLSIPRYLRDRPITLKTKSGRWPTVWGEDEAREMKTTRRALLTWCSDIQSYAPTKQLIRLLAEHALDPNERKILDFLVSNEGQGVFCELRTGPHVTLLQLLHAFPSSKPPLDDLLSVLPQLMPRFYSLSNDPHEACRPVEGCSRVIEIAVTVHETPDWRSDSRTGLGSGFFERQAIAFIEATKRGEKPDLRIPMFKGLMENPLAKQFNFDGPMLLIGAGVGIAPFRGFIQRRLKSAKCANKVYILQGIRNRKFDELYGGELGGEETIRKVAQSRSSEADGRGKYVQEEVLEEKELCWEIANHVDGRICVCGSKAGMGEGVEESLITVAMEEGGLAREEAVEFWRLKREAGQYITELW